MHIVHGMQFRPEAHNWKVLASLLSQQNYTRDINEKKQTLTYQLIEAKISTGARKKKIRKKKEITRR